MESVQLCINSKLYYSSLSAVKNSNIRCHTMQSFLVDLNKNNYIFETVVLPDVLVFGG